MNRIAMLFVPTLVVLTVIGCSRPREAAISPDVPQFVAQCRVEFDNMTGRMPMSRAADVYKPLLEPASRT